MVNKGSSGKAGASTNGSAAEATPPRVPLKRLAQECGVCTVTVWRVSKGLPGVAPETSARIRKVAAEAGLRFPEPPPVPDEPPREPAVPTLRMLAERCGVSISTVSRALQNDVRVAPETAARVHRIAKELGYNPAHHQAARQLVLQRHGKSVLNRTIGLFFPPHFSTMENAGYFVRIFDGIMVTAMEARYSVVTTYSAYPDPTREPTHYALLEGLPLAYPHGDIDGALILGGEEEVGHTMRLLRQEPNFGQRPVATMLTPVEGACCIQTDDAAGMRAAVEHLLELGHRRFLLVLDDVYVNVARLRVQGCRDALQTAGIDPDEALVISEWEWNDVGGSVQQAWQTYGEAADMTAVLAQNDTVARILYDQFRRNRLEVPRDVSLVGFDDTGVLRDRNGRNFLTTVRIPLEDIGRTACQWLLHAVEHDGEKAAPQMLPTRLIVRGTTAAPRAG